MHEQHCEYYVEAYEPERQVPSQHTTQEVGAEEAG